MRTFVTIILLLNCVQYFCLHFIGNTFISFIDVVVNVIVGSIEVLLEPGSCRSYAHT